VREAAKPYEENDILTMVNEGLNVFEMAERLNTDIELFSDFYARCSADNRTAFPIRLLITKSWLEKQLMMKPVIQICNETYTSPSVIRRLMRLYGLKQKPRLKDILTPEVLFELYVEKRLTDRKIAETFHCSIEAVKKLRAQNSITHDERISESRIPSIEYFHRLHVIMGFTIKQISLLTGQPGAYIKRLSTTYSHENHPLAAEIAAQNKYYAFQSLINQLLERVERSVLFEQLKTHSLAETAEMYNIIPPPEPGVETFSPEWLEIQLHRKTVQQIIDEYYIGINFIKVMMRESDLKPLSVTDRINPDIVRLLYLQNNWTDAEIARAFGVSVYAVSALRKKHHILPADKLTVEERLDAEEFRRLYIDEGLSLLQISSLYQTPVSKISMLKKKYGKKHPEITTHIASGVSDGRMQYLKKALKHKDFTKS
jgi:hypothetical protein